MSRSERVDLGGTFHHQRPNEASDNNMTDKARRRQQNGKNWGRNVPIACALAKISEKRANCFNPRANLCQIVQESRISRVSPAMKFRDVINLLTCAIARQRPKSGKDRKAQSMKAVISKEDLNDYLQEVFPQVWDQFEIMEMDGRYTTMRLRVSGGHLRPGGTVSGPSMFGLADVSAYVATLACVGKQALAVTTNCSIDFMRKPVANRDLIARAELLKLGKALSVVDVRIASEGSEDLVARASLTYSIPPAKM